MAALAVVGVAAMVGFALAADTDTSIDASHPVTGQLSSMGVPFIETPGSQDGVAEAAGVTVDGSSWALGRVPLDVAVLPTWILRNEGSEAVTIGAPHAEVQEGCCPGPITVSQWTLQPGEQAIVDFELAMHRGMDGWHDIAVHVPVVASANSAVLELQVTGHFGDAAASAHRGGS